MLNWAKVVKHYKLPEEREQIQVAVPVQPRSVWLTESGRGCRWDSALLPLLCTGKILRPKCDYFKIHKFIVFFNAKVYKIGLRLKARAEG